MAQPALVSRDDDSFFGWVDRLVHAHRAGLVRLARHEGLDAEDALECVQEAFHTFLLLPQARRLVEEPEESAKLLHVVARNVARNRRRRHDRARPHDTDETTIAALVAGDPSADELVGQAETYVRVVGCLATLGELQRAVVSLRLVDDVPGEDVAEMLGTSSGNVAVILHRAKGKLAACVS